MLKSSLLQRQLKINADVLSGLYEEIAKLRAARKMYNERADELAKEAFEVGCTGSCEGVLKLESDAKANREQAAVYTPYIRKFKKKIAAVEEVQRMLKSELKGQQSIEAWVEMDDVEWQGLVKMAQQEDYQVTYSYDQLAEMFGEE